MSEAVSDQALEAAVKLHQSGRIERAADAYRRILADRPDHAHALHLLGVTELQSGHFAEAANWIAKATALEPNIGLYHLNLATALRALRRVDECIAEAEKTIVLDEKIAPQAYHVAALAFVDGGQPAEAVRCWVKALEIDASFAEAHLALSMLLDRTGKVEPAVLQLEHAADLARQWVEREPGAPTAHLLLARCHEQAGQLADAIREYRAATKLLPHDAGVFHALGAALARQGQADEAMTALRFATRMNPRFAEAHLALASLHLAQLRPAEAHESLRTALQITPSHPEAHARLADVLAAQGEVEQAIAAARRAVELDPWTASIGSTLLRTLHFDAHLPPRELFDAHLAWGRRHADTLRSAIRPCANVNDPDRPLRLGFVSPNFKRHPLAKSLLPILEHLDRRQFQLYFYCDSFVGDDVSRQMIAFATEWRVTSAWSDTRLAQLVRHDQIDILIDLSGHGEGNRLLAFAQKPAPVQVTQLGYPGTSGVATIDYHITHAFADPPGEADQLHTAALVRLPTPPCFRPWEPTPARLENRTNDVMTFGSVSDLSLLSADTLSAWANLLSAAPQSRLLVLANTRDEPDRIRERLVHHGIDNFRLTVVPRVEGRDYLELFNQFDIALDTFPVSGKTTAGDALWMGRPIVTLAGQAPASRGAAAFLHHVGLEDLIAASADQYIDIAARLSNDRPRLAHLLETLRQTLTDSPLFDAGAYAAALGDFYRDAWRRYCKT